jgi:hypothetical protein
VLIAEEPLFALAKNGSMENLKVMVIVCLKAEINVVAKSVTRTVKDQKNAL